MKLAEELKDYYFKALTDDKNDFGKCISDIDDQILDAAQSGFTSVKIIFKQHDDVPDSCGLNKCIYPLHTIKSIKMIIKLIEDYYNNTKITIISCNDHVLVHWDEIVDTVVSKVFKK